MESTGHYRLIGSRPNATPLAIGGLLVGAAILAFRRLTGAFESALPSPALVATAAFFAVAIWSTRIARPQTRAAAGLSGRGAFEAQILKWGPAVAVLLAMIAFSWPMARLVDWLVWLPILAVEAVFAGNLRSGLGIRLRGRSSPRADTGAATKEPTDTVLQQLTRIRDRVTAEEALFGKLRAEFAISERVAVLHVAFCPPLEKTPEVHAEQAEGPNATVRVTQVLPHGARLEVRLAQPSEEASSVDVDFAAH